MEEKKLYVPKLLAIIGFSLIMTCIVAFGIANVGIFFENIVEFIFGLYITAIVFLLCLILFIISFILVFGFYIFEEYGFWPGNATTYIFKQVMGELGISQDQIQALNITVIIILVLVVSALSLAIISEILNKQEIQKNNPNVKRVKPFNIITIIFSSIGLLVCVSLILLVLII